MHAYRCGCLPLALRLCGCALSSSRAQVTPDQLIATLTWTLTPALTPTLTPTLSLILALIPAQSPTLSLALTVALALTLRAGDTGSAHRAT